MKPRQPLTTLPRPPVDPPANAMMGEHGGDSVGTFRIPQITNSLMSSTTFDASAPRPLVKAYHDEFQKHRDSGSTHEDAHHRAIRHTQRMGWFKGPKGWKKVLPDMQDKINVTQGVRQPDGTYYIECVPVFHPNAVKGAEHSFSEKDLDQIIANTNAAVHSGGSKPVLLEGHPDELQKAMGKQLDARGFPVNFRKNPKTKMVECDFIRVDPEYWDRLKKQKLPSLSAGFAKDAHGLNRRFGHVALLGGTSPALSHLPTTEYFSASGNCLCFAADTEVFPKGKSMLSSKKKDCFAALSSAKEAYDAAEKSKEMGQPDADARMTEAYTAYAAAEADYAAAMTGDDEGTGPVGNTVQDTSAIPAMGNGDAAGTYGDMQTMPTPMGDAAMPPTPTAAGVGAGATGEDFAAMKDVFADPAGDPSVAFSAVVDELAAMKQQQTELRKLLAEANDAKRLLKSQELWRNYSAEIETLRRSGRQLPNNEIIREEFSSFGEFRDPTKAATLRLKAYRSLPAQSTPATVNGGQPVFSAEDAHGNHKPSASKQELASRLQKAGIKTDDESIMFAALADKM